MSAHFNNCIQQSKRLLNSVLWYVMFCLQSYCTMCGAVANTSMNVDCVLVVPSRLSPNGTAAVGRKKERRENNQARTNQNVIHKFRPFSIQIYMNEERMDSVVLRTNDSTISY